MGFWVRELCVVESAVLGSFYLHCPAQEEQSSSDEGMEEGEEDEEEGGVQAQEPLMTAADGGSVVTDTGRSMTVCENNLDGSKTSDMGCSMSECLRLSFSK